MSRPRRWRTFTLGVLLLVAVAAPPPTLAANTLVHGTPLASWDGAVAFFNAKEAGPDTLTPEGWYQYQCAELVQRYYWTKGWVKSDRSHPGVSPAWGGPNAAGMLAVAKANTKGQVLPRSNPSSYAPVPGDAVVFEAWGTSGWQYGHVALITDVNLEDGSISILQQNVAFMWFGELWPFVTDRLRLSTYQRWETGKDGKRHYVTQYVIDSDVHQGWFWNYTHVAGWLHAAANKKPPKAAVQILWQP